MAAEQTQLDLLVAVVTFWCDVDQGAPLRLQIHWVWKGNVGKPLANDVFHQWQFFCLTVLELFC